MDFNRRKLLGTGAGLSAVGLAAACGGGGTSSPNTSASNPASSGASSTPNLGNQNSVAASANAADIDESGVLNIVQTSAFDHLDPQQIYVTNATAFGRLMFRQLMAFKEDPATGSFTLVPDLAAALPVASKNNTVWTFKLKTGLKFDDGTPITSADLKYGVERSMDPNIPNGPQYAKKYLLGADKYVGPAKGADLKSIAVPDASTIVFTLNQPVGTWDQLCTLSTFTPTPKAKDTGKTYDLHPVCSGPYKIQSYSHDTKIVLVRNTNWDKSTDPLRSQHFAQINCTMNVNESAVDNDLFSDVNGGSDAMFTDVPIPGDIPKASSAQFANRTLKADTSAIAYYGVQQNQPALKDKRVRQAIMYSRNPAASIKAAGGPLVGFPTQSMAPTVLKGFSPAPVYYPDLGPEGNPAKAKQLLQEAGVSNLKVTLPYANTGASAAATVQVTVQALARSGITLIPKPLNPTNYYTVTGTLTQKFDLISTGWLDDIPDGSTIYPPLFQGGTNIYDGTANAGRVNDPVLDKMMAAALLLTSSTALAKWQAIDRYVCENCLAIPRFQSRDIQLVGSKVKGAYVSPVLGTMDVTNAYISKS